MIFAASLNLVGRKALPNKCAQKSVGYIINALPLNPDESQMEVVILGPQDFRAAASGGLNTALSNKHPNVCAIYFYSKDAEKSLCTADGVYTKQAKKIDVSVVKDAVSEFYGQQLRDNTIQVGDGSDRIGAGDRNPVPKRAVQVNRRPEREEKTETDTQEARTPEPEEPAPQTELNVEPEPQPQPEPVAQERKLPPSPMELVESCKTFEDWDVLTEQLKRDSVISDALLRSSEFQGVRQMMDVYSVKMNDVMADSRLTPEQKMDAIKEFGHSRQVLAAASNSKMVDDWLKLWHCVCSVAESIVRDRLDAIQSAVASTQVNMNGFIEQQVTAAHDAETKVSEYAVEIANIQARLVNLWQFAYNESVTNIGAHLNDDLPSDNAYINSYIGEAAKEFNTDNAESLINKIFTGLRQGNLSLSQVQDELGAMYNVCFKTMERLGEVTFFQKDVIDMLRANHVENIVIRDTLLKDCFRVFVGTSGVGTSATVAIYASMMARRQNTVVIDLTGHAKYERYGQEPISLGRFMEERVQQPLLFVTTNDSQDPEQLALLMSELKARMSYYRNIIVVLDAAQKEELDQLGRDALTISFITNCTSDSLDAVSVAYRESRGIPNVGRMLVAIDAPVDASVLVKTLALDVSTTRLVLLPYHSDVRKIAITKSNPADYGDILSIYEAAFRV